MLSMSEASRGLVKDEDEILRLSAQDDITDAIAFRAKKSFDQRRQFATLSNGLI